MPLPSPNKNEEQKPFISRCISNDSVKSEYTDNEQRVAVCFSQWKGSKKDSADEVKRSFVVNLDYSNKSEFRVDEVTGFLHARARLTRSGVFDYYDDKGNLFREYRSDDEVFDKDSMESLGLRPITNDHPDSLVTTENIKDLQVGTIGENIVKDKEFLSSSIMITDKDMVQTVINRKKSGLTTELSCGYSCNLIPGIGIHEKDGYYTFKQQKIRYNHVGIVDKARAGHNVRIMDKNHNGKNHNNKKEFVMPKIQFTRKAVDINSLKMDAITQVVEDDSLGPLNILSNKLDEAVVVITSLNKDNSELQGKFDQSNETIKTLQAKVDSLSDVNSPVLTEMMKVRVDVEKVAAELKVDCADKDLNTIKCDCIKAASQNADLEGKNADYINARFDSVKEMLVDHKKNDGNHKFSNFMKNVTDKTHGTPSDPRAAFINKDKDQNRK